MRRLSHERRGFRSREGDTAVLRRGRSITLTPLGGGTSIIPRIL